MMEKRVLFATVAIVLIAAAACIPSTSAIPTITPTTLDAGLVIDSGLFDTSSCKPPCWQNLIPGASSTNDVDLFIKSLGTREWPHRKNHSYGSGCVWKRVIDSEHTHAADFYLENDKLTFVQWIMPPEITLQQIAEHFGPPQYFRAVLTTGHEESYYFIDVYYPTLGIAFEVSPRQEEANFILPTMRVRVVQYFVPGDVFSYFVAKYSCNYGSDIAKNMAENEVSTYVQSWSGFGKIIAIPSP